MLMITRSLAFALCACLSLSRAAVAQSPSGNAPMSYEAIAKAEVGAWAEYTTAVKGKPDAIKVRYALVEKTAKRIAIEIDGQTPMGPLLVRMEFEAGGPDSWKLTKARMQMAGASAQDMPMPAEVPTIKKGEKVGELVGKSALKTPSGTFDTEQYRKSFQQGGVNMTIDFWMSDKVLPVGLVKQSTTDGNLTTLLAATGTGATSKMAKPATPEGKPAK